METPGETKRIRIEYAPGPSQWEFHASAARFKGFCGPVGSGKTLAICQEALKLAFLNPGLPGVIAAATFPLLRDVTQRAFLAILAHNGIRHDYHKSERRVTLLDTASEIWFRSMHEPDMLRGPNLAWYACDELTYAPWESWQQLQARLRHAQANALHGLAAFTPKGFDRVQEFFFFSGGSGRTLIRARPMENAPHLAPGYYQELEQSLDPLTYRQEVLGEFLNVFAGAVYWAFARDGNVRQMEYDPALPLCWSLDFNVDPFCSVIGQSRALRPGIPGIQTESPLEIRVLDEIRLRGANTWEMCEEFTRRWEKHRGRLLIYGDPGGQARHTSAAGKTDWQLIREFFQTAGRKMRPEFRVLEAAPAVKDRVQAVNAKLLNAAGVRTLKIAPGCKYLIADLERVAYKPGSAVVDKSGDPALTHLSDALGYWIAYEWMPRSPAGERGREAGRLV